MYIYIYLYTPNGELIITTLYTHMYTHTNILFVLQTSHHQIYIYIHIYFVSPHRVKYLFYRTDSPPSCIYIYIYIYTLFHHTELTSVWLPRLLSFTTLGKPTIWMVTYLSPSYTRICTHTYTVCFTDSPTSYIYIYIYIYTLFHHIELTSVLPYRWPSLTTLGKPTIWMVTYLSPSYTPICTRMHTHIYRLFYR